MHFGVSPELPRLLLGAAAPTSEHAPSAAESSSGGATPGPNTGLDFYRHTVREAIDGYRAPQDVHGAWAELLGPLSCVDDVEVCLKIEKNESKYTCHDEILN